MKKLKTPYTKEQAAQAVYKSRRKSKITLSGDTYDLTPFFFDSTQQLIIDLNKITRIKKTDR